MKDRTLPSQNIYTFFAGGASVFTSGKKQASITVEAAMTVPLFFFAVVTLLYFMEIMAIQTAVRSGLQYAGKEMAKEAGAAAGVVPWKMERQVVKAIGTERLKQSIVVGGSAGIRCEKSRRSSFTGIYDLSAEYEIRLPIPVFAVKPVTCRQQMRVKGWTGYEKTGFGEGREDTVYVTETGMVYHNNYHCTYLELSIKMTAFEGVEALRNEDGGKYYPCEHCAKGSVAAVYITGTGNRYHNTLGCSGLKRTIYAVPVSETVGKGACARCGE